MNLISSIWFWLGLLGVSVVTYGVFDALNTQEEKSVSGVDIQNVQVQTQVEINEATKEADSSTSKVELNPSAEEDVEEKESAPEDAEVIPVEVFLDTARIDVDGLVTLAGRAEPGATIEVLVGEILIGTISVGKDGSFASIFELSSSEEIRVVVLRTDKGDDFVYADQSLVILPSQIAKKALEEDLQLPDEVASLEPSGETAPVGSVQMKGSVESQEVETDKSDEKLTSENNVQPEPVENPEIELNAAEVLEEDQAQKSSSKQKEVKVSDGLDKEETVQVDPSQLGSQETQAELQETLEKSEILENKAVIPESDSDVSVSDNAADISNPTMDSSTSQPKVVVADSDGVRVLQDHQGAKDQLALDSIAYDPSGNVTLSGRSNPDGLVRFYVNNEAVSAAKTDDSGYWETDLSDVIPGTYTLRIDELGSRGDVVSRLESPFKREDRQKLAALIAPSSSPVRINIVTVQPGNTLWAIARKRYGDGLLYVRVFEANRDKIKDPDLIYPGQLFDLPDLN
ncbi:MAG: LysM peptidoglycan-binding domain-containing protein [Rhodobacteraceae bacterium]|nr:LysM peptidoglycan-binding domain-containing protein [Paracoccaceae bacterium]